MVPIDYDGKVATVDHLDFADLDDEYTMVRRILAAKVVKPKYCSDGETL